MLVALLLEDHPDDVEPIQEQHDGHHGIFVKINDHVAQTIENYLVKAHSSTKLFPQVDPSFLQNESGSESESEAGTSKVSSSVCFLSFITSTARATQRQINVPANLANLSRRTASQTSVPVTQIPQTAIPRKPTRFAASYSSSETGLAEKFLFAIGRQTQRPSKENSG